MKAQQEHNSGGYYLMQDWRGYSLLSCDSLNRMRRSKYANPEFTANLSEAAWFQTLEDAHVAFRECAARLQLITTPTDHSFRSISHEEAILLMVGDALAK